MFSSENYLSYLDDSMFRRKNCPYRPSECGRFDCTCKGEKIQTVNVATKGKHDLQKIQQRLGFISERTLADTIRAGSVANIPITIHDVEETLKTHGRHPATLQGKAQRAQRPHVPLVVAPKLQQKELTLHIDVMFCEREPFLISVSDPMDLTRCDALAGGIPTKEGIKSAMNMKAHLFSQLEKYNSYGFRVTKVICNSDSSFIHIIPDLELLGILVAPGVSASHPSGRIDKRISSIKEMVRSMLASLPYNTPMFLLKFAVLFAVSRFNLISHNPSWDCHVSPRELLTGM